MRLYMYCVCPSFFLLENDFSNRKSRAAPFNSTQRIMYPSRPESRPMLCAYADRASLRCVVRSARYELYMNVSIRFDLNTINRISSSTLFVELAFCCCILWNSRYDLPPPPPFAPEGKHKGKPGSAFLPEVLPVPPPGNPTLM